MLSRGAEPLAVAVVREAGGNARPVLTAAAAKELLRTDGAQRPALADGSEVVRELAFPVPKGNEKDRLGVILRARKASSGARLLFSSAFSGPSLDSLLPGGTLPAPPPLELAVQLFPDAQGHVAIPTYIDGTRQPRPWEPLPGGANTAPAESPAVQQRPARVWTFETKNGYLVNVARSAPAAWTLRQTDGGVLLTARLLPDPRQRGECGAFVVYLGAGADEAPPEVSPLKLDKRETPARDLIEGSVRVYASGADPFVLNETAVVAEIVCPPKPGGEPSLKRLPCFFWEAPPSAPAEGEFRFRYAPPAEGVYGVRIVVIAATGQGRGDALAFRAGPPASPGFVKVRAGERQFRYDDGTVFFPLGLQTPAPGAVEPSQYRAGFVDLVCRGGNAFPLFVCERGLRLEGPAGRFDAAVAARLDEVLLAAQARDIGVVVCAQDAEGVAAHSAEHPYFREKGGPLAAAPEFFRNVAAKKLFQNRLTYLAARYGAYRSVLAWELMDRVDEAWAALKQNPDDPKLKPEEADLARRARRDVQDWAEAMALHIHGMDAHEHPVWLSTARHPDVAWTDLELVEHLDATLAHVRLDGARPGEEPDLLSRWAEKARQPGRAHKPYLIASLDCTALRPKEGWPAGTLEASAHDSLFGSLAAGLCGAPVVTSEGKAVAAGESLQAAAYFAKALGVVAMAQGKDEPRLLAEDIEAPDGVRVRVAGRSGQRGLALWLRAARTGGAAREISGLELRMPGVLEGEYQVVWLDTWRGVAVRSEVYKAPGRQVDQPLAPVVLRAPPFRRDMALWMTRR